MLIRLVLAPKVHLICMPADKDNICKKSAQFHFVNDYLYKPLQDEDGNNSTLYADRYYPDGYEPGVPFDMSDVTAPDRPNLQAFNRRPPQQANRQRIQPQNSFNRYPNERRVIISLYWG